MNRQSIQLKVFLFAGIVLSIFVFGTASAEAANWYVRQGATGSNNGTDWTNAYTSLPITLIRGDTYYIADGNYDSYTFDDAVSGSTYIYIKKATIASHGTSTGWNDTYGDGQAVFTGATYVWNLRSGYWDIDGVTGSGTSGYGIKVVSTNSTENTCTVCISSNYNVSYSIFKHIEFQGEATGTRVFWNNASATTNLTISYNYFHGGRVWLSAYSLNMIAEFNYFKDAITTDPNLHGAGIVLMANNATIRYNILENTIGSMTTYIEPQGIRNGIYIYGNIFKATSNSERSSQGIFAITSSDVATDVKIYNNTVYGIHSAQPGVWCGNVAGSDCVVQNNIWQNTTYGTINCTRCTTFNNNILTSDSASFINAAGGDFHLSTPTVAGVTLSSPYTQDIDGIVRAVDGVWDRGAYEYLASNQPPSDTTSPSIPTNLSATPISSSQINLSWIASTDNVGVLGYRIFRDSSQLSTVTGQLSYSDTNLSPSTSYTYTVSAYDAAGNNSNQSSPVSTTTQSSSPPTGNLLLNPDFEGGFTNNLANSWNITTDGSIDYLLSQDTGYQGLSQKINISSPGSWGLFYYQTPAFQLNQFYDWSFWYKTQATGSLWAQITNAPQTQTILSESLSPTNNQWTYKTINFQYTNSLANQLRFSSNSTSPYWIDNIQLAVASSDTIPPAPPAGLVIQ